jgi:hypothetical protein
MSSLIKGRLLNISVLDGSKPLTAATRARIGDNQPAGETTHEETETRKCNSLVPRSNRLSHRSP